MESVVQYLQPPIVEVIVAFQVAPAGDLQAAQSWNPGAEEFPDSTSFKRVEVEVEDGPRGRSTTTHHRPPGFGYRSSDRQMLVQVSPDGFAVNWLRVEGGEAYPGWGVLGPRVRRLLGWFCDQAKPQTVQAIELQYTNHLHFTVDPSRPASLDDFLRTLPDLSRDLPQQIIGGYALRLDLPQPDIAAEAVMSQALLPDDTPGGVSIGLDLILRKREALPPPSDSDALWAVVEQLHAREKRMFEASITNRTREALGGSTQEKQT